MTAQIVPFLPKAELDARKNLAAFIDFCRNRIAVFGAELEFDADCWIVSDSIELTAMSKTVRVFFTRLAEDGEAGAPMAQPFGLFARAYFRYQHAMRPTRSTGGRIAALRALEQALVEGSEAADPTRSDAGIFNRAAGILRQRLSAGNAYRAGGQLEMIADFLSDKHLVVAPLQWRNPIARPLDGARVGAEFDLRRQEKLPSPGALHALARAFHMATEPGDVLATSIAALLCAAPSRISEVLLLEDSCEVVQKNSAREDVFGLRWRPAKGADPMVKFVVPSMWSVVQQALTNIRRVTAEARAVARWYEANPRKLYLPGHLESLRGRALSMKEVSQVLYRDETKDEAAMSWCRRKGLVLQDSQFGPMVMFDRVEAAVVGDLPRKFPYLNKQTKLKYSEALCVVFPNIFNSQKPDYCCLVEGIGHQHVSDRLGGRAAIVRSVFERLGLTEEGGTPIRVVSHQFRHYLNTLAQRGGLSQLDIAKWSGRVDVSQNRVYDHTSDRDALEVIRSAIGDESRMFGPLATAPKLALLRRDEFANVVAPTAHVTELGYCIHDYTMLPCQQHMDCLNCPELVIIKGDRVCEANLRKQRDQTRGLLEKAEAEVFAGNAGADRWLVRHRTQVKKLEEACAIIDDPTVPDGSVIQVAPAPSQSRLAAAHARRVGGNQRRLTRAALAQE